MPRPPPINRHEFRSSAVAWDSRGYQATGAEIVRPSAISTDNVSLVTFTWVAIEAWCSTAKELIPLLQQLQLVLLNQLGEPVDFLRGEPVTSLKADRIEPELGLTIIAFDVDVRRLAAIASVKEESKRTTSKHGGHRLMLRHAYGTRQSHEFWRLRSVGDCVRFTGHLDGETNDAEWSSRSSGDDGEGVLASSICVTRDRP